MKLLTIIIFLVLSSVAHADKSDGCGPGLAVTRKTTLSATSTRKTTDVVLFPTKWLAFTSGTSGCATHDIVKKNRDSFELIAINYYALSAEIARGEGQILHAFAKSFHCNNHVVEKFKDHLKQRYDQIIPQEKDDFLIFLLNARKVLQENHFIKSQCPLLT